VAAISKGLGGEGGGATFAELGGMSSDVKSRFFARNQSMFQALLDGARVTLAMASVLHQEGGGEGAPEGRQSVAGGGGHCGWETGGAAAGEGETEGVGLGGGGRGGREWESVRELEDRLKRLVAC
jgi:hypothetical protein